MPAVGIYKRKKKIPSIKPLKTISIGSMIVYNPENKRRY